MKISYVYIYVSLPTTTTTDRRKNNIESNYKAQASIKKTIQIKNGVLSVKLRLPKTKHGGGVKYVSNQFFKPDMKRLQLEMNKNVNIQRNTFQLFLSYAGRTRKVATAHNQSKRFLFTSAGLSQGMPTTIETRRLSFFMHKKNRTRQVKCALGIKHRHSQVRAVNNDKIRLLSQ